MFNLYLIKNLRLIQKQNILIVDISKKVSTLSVKNKTILLAQRQMK